METSSSASTVCADEEDGNELLSAGGKGIGKNAIDAITMDEVDESLMELVDDVYKEDGRALEGALKEGGEPSEETGYHQWADSIPDNHFEVQVPSFEPGSGFGLYDNTVERVLRELKKRGELNYVVKLRSGQTEEHSPEELREAPGGKKALVSFSRSIILTSASEESQSDSEMLFLRPPRRSSTRAKGFVDSAITDISESSEASRRSGLRRFTLTKPRKNYTSISSDDLGDFSSDELTSVKPRRKGRPSKHALTAAPRREMTRTRNSGMAVNYVDQLFDSENSDKSDKDFSRSNLGKRKRQSGPVRRSERESRATINMRELYEDDIPIATRTSSRGGAPKVFGVKEKFERLRRSDEFRNRHLMECNTCYEIEDNREKGPLVFCQGCTFAYHVTCLGVRKGRTHLVTKVAEDQFVLQCRRCIEYASRNEPAAPHQGKCQVCHKTGKSCAPFQPHKTPKQEQEEREQNNGEDPVVSVAQNLINNPKNVLFRCASCFQAFHFHHLPPRRETLFEVDEENQKAEKRWLEYCEDWTCHFCLAAKAVVGGLIAWRPLNPDNYSHGVSVDEVVEDEKEYLIKWQNRSYNQSEWMPGPWVWGVTHKSMRIAFARRDDGKCLPRMRTEDAIPEDYLRVDIVFQVEYNNIVQEKIEEVDLARVTEVERAQVKYKGLGYEDTVWEVPPDPVQDPERWADFKAAYEDWVRGCYLKPPTSTTGNNIRKAKSQPFQSLKTQPKTLTGGELMDYQIDGLNWIFYQWHRNHNAILADEMGLGKTIQVIGFMATLVEKFNCWPFLVVVPNATCANWRREIKRWAPNLRVVTYFGSAKARELAEKHELFSSDHSSSKDSKSLRCHIVVTSYDAAQEVSCQRILKRIYWQSLIVDEGQRLKSDKNILYGALSMLRSPFKLLLTGTPLQNNQRELFNLLQFLDSSINAEELERKYEVLDKNAVSELHDLLRPFFLRRTKAQVLKFLPTMAQVIVPVTMTPLQKQLYKSILAKNSDLLKSIFGGERRYSAKGGLRNILMQLRKCLCHPFVYSINIEERSSEAAVSHQRLVEASAKLQLLEIMLPKLQERGHRVLIFSQFLDMLTLVEDFLQGLEIEHIRLDGTMGSLEKQKCIDMYNAPNSSIFAFLLSTRAGGVGINLATADTVIILDPDFNPHQDIQAISRAHRIGQKKKVLIFRLMTRGSAEEKIMQIGKKKMALDHVLIEAMEDEEMDGNELEDVLKFGAEALFKDDTSADIRYDSASVDKLLDRSQVEDTKVGQDDSAESQFSFARIWQNDEGTMKEALGQVEERTTSTFNPTVWDAILKERARQHEIETKMKENTLGRGKRHRRTVVGPNDDLKSILGSDNDTDFKEKEESENENSSSDDGALDAAKAAEELKSPEEKPSRSRILASANSKSSAYKSSHCQLTRLEHIFKRAVLPPEPTIIQLDGADSVPLPLCLACNGRHRKGNCPRKRAGIEHCPLCGEAHYGYQRTCPQLSSEKAVREMMEALKQSPEDSLLKDKAKASLQMIKGSIVARKRQQAMKRAEGVLKDSDGNRNEAIKAVVGTQATQVQSSGWRPPPQSHPPQFQPAPPLGSNGTYSTWNNRPPNPLNSPPGMAANPYAANGLPHTNPPPPPVTSLSRSLQNIGIDTNWNEARRKALEETLRRDNAS